VNSSHTAGAATTADIDGIQSLKDAFQSQPIPSRNDGQVKQSNTGSSFSSVPRLDLKKLKKVQDFKDWYTYA